jgi:anti-sigma B factor antagonist
MDLEVSKLKIVERPLDDVTVLSLSGEILLDDGDLEFRKKVHDLVDRGRVHIVVDLGGVSHVDSAGVGMLVAKQKTVREHGGDIKLVHVSSRSQRLLAIMRLAMVFETFDDESEAIRSFAAKH